MGLAHLKPAEKVNLIALHGQHGDLPQESSFALTKTDRMEVIRLALSAGKQIPEHRVDGEITIQCLSGQLTFSVETEPSDLVAGDWMYLSANQNHSLKAITDCVVLVTIWLTKD